MWYVVFAESSAALAMSSAVREIGGKPFRSCWLVLWHGTADSLLSRLRHAVVVCRVDDCSYR